MKRFFITITLVSFTILGFSQENLINLTGGYAWMNIDDSEYLNEDPNIKATGWRITGTYDFNSNQGNFAYGVSLGYTTVGATYEDTGGDKTDYTMNSIPLYFAPKYLFGSDRVKGFLKLMIGGQSATLKRSGNAGSVTASDFGFYGGAGAGIMFFVSDKVFINLEYEVAYVTNNYYRNGLLQSASGGIGIKF